MAGVLALVPESSLFLVFVSFFFMTCAAILYICNIIDFCQPRMLLVVAPCPQSRSLSRGESLQHTVERYDIYWVIFACEAFLP